MNIYFQILHVFNMTLKMSIRMTIYESHDINIIHFISKLSQ